MLLNLLNKYRDRVDMYILPRPVPNAARERVPIMAAMMGLLVSTQVRQVK
jgi:hypothetical protein